MKVNKKIGKSLISIILILSMVISPFTSFSNAKASTVKGIAESNETAVLESFSTTVNSVSGGAVTVIQNPYIGDDYEVKFNIDSQWQGAFNGNITITNTGSKTIENWELTFESKDNITNIWNAIIVSHEGNIYKIKNAGWNQDIEPGKSVSFGFGATFENEVTIPTEYKMLGEVQEVSEEKCKITYYIGSQWDTGYVMEVTLTNISDAAIEDWEIVFDLGHEITNIWNGSIVFHENGHYDIKNCGYNSNISAGGSVSFGFQASITDKSLALLPTYGVLKQVSANSDDETDREIDNEWSQKMINADAENVIAARDQVNNIIKVALIDSGVNYSTETNVAVRKNFLPDYDEEDLNPLFDDLSGHGSAAAALIASDSSQPVVEDDGTMMERLMMFRKQMSILVF